MSANTKLDELSQILAAAKARYHSTQMSNSFGRTEAESAIALWDAAVALNEYCQAKAALDEAVKAMPRGIQ